MSELLITFTREQIAAYAEASGDMNPIHLDDDFAKMVGLPGVIAHGLLQMGLLARAAADAAGGPTHLRSLTCRFAGMVLPGDRVTFSARVKEPGSLELSALNQRSESVLTKASASFV
jgi:acyl dehydratase